MDKYLLEILKEVNTIIIPGLGALTITNPDTGEIMFMSYLKHDDGKLAAYIVNKEGIDENEAKNQIAKYVRQILTDLDKGESYDMFEFGSFYKKNDEIDFKNWEGSGSKVTSVPKTIEKPEVKKEEEKKTIPVAKTDIPEIEKKVENISKSSATEAEKKVPENASTSSATGAQKDVSEKKKSESDKVVEDKATKKVSEVKEAPKKAVPEVKVPEKSVKSPIKEEEKKNVTPIPPSAALKDKKELNILQKEEKAATAAKMKKLKEKQSENSQKKKRGVGFWMLIGLIVIIIAGGTFVGMNYDMVKEHIPFLADNNKKKEKVEKKSPKDKMKEILGQGAEEQVTENEATEDEVTKETIPLEDVKESETPKEVIKQKPIVEETNSSDELPFHIIAGAFSSEDNANRLADKLSKKGYATEVYFGRGMHLVSIKSYASKSDAHAGINEVMADAPNAWIHEKQ